MKSKLSLLVFLMIGCLVFTTSCGSKKDAAPDNKSVTTEAQTNSAVKKTYPFKSCFISYEVSAMGLPQTQMLYIDNYGEKEARYTEMIMEMMGQKIETKDVEINADGFKTKFDQVKKTGTKSKSFGSMIVGSTMPSASQLSKSMMEQYKYKEIGEKEIMGKKCKGYTMVFMDMNCEAWSWENIPIMMKMIDKKGKTFMEMKATKKKEVMKRKNQMIQKVMLRIMEAIAIAIMKIIKESRHCQKLK